MRNDSALSAALVLVEASAATRARLLPSRPTGLISRTLGKVRLPESGDGFESRTQHSGHCHEIVGLLAHRECGTGDALCAAKLPSTASPTPKPERMRLLKPE